MIRFHVTEYVQVALTVYGRNAHKRRHDALKIMQPWLPPYQPILEDAEGYSTWQLGEFLVQFAQFFGHESPIMKGPIRLPEVK